ncbi:MAG: ABC transporter substrate-binding protein [Candidatus Methanoperedens sp.]
MSNNIKFLSIAVIAVAIIGAGLFFAEEEKTKDEIVPVRGSATTTPSVFEIAKKLTGRDFLEEEGVKYEPVIIQGGEGGTVTFQALLSKNIDTSGGAIGIWVNAVGKGAKVKLVYPSAFATEESSKYEGLLVLENSSIYTIKDLVGKKIAVNVLGASADFTTRKFLVQNGLSIDQVQLVVVPAANEELALRSKQVDAAAWTISGSTQYDMTVDRGGVRKLPGTSIYEVRRVKTVNAVVGFREDFIQEHPETVRRYLRALDSASRLIWTEIRKDPERVQKAYADIAEEKGDNPKLAKFYRGPKAAPEDKFFTDNDVQVWIDDFVEAGTLKPGQIKPSDVYTNEFNPYYNR